MYAAKYIEARTAAMVISTAPALAALLEIAVLSQYPSSQEIVGGLVMIVGVLLCIARPKKERQSAPA